MEPKRALKNKRKASKMAELEPGTQDLTYRVERMDLQKLSSDLQMYSPWVTNAPIPSYILLHIPRHTGRHVPANTHRMKMSM